MVLPCKLLLATICPGAKKAEGGRQLYHFNNLIGTELRPVKASLRLVGAGFIIIKRYMHDVRADAP